MRNEKLFTQKEYKKCIKIFIGSLIFNFIIGFIGTFIMIFALTQIIMLLGIIIIIISIILFFFSALYGFMNSAKIQLYRNYKKNPQEFESKT